MMEASLHVDRREMYCRLEKLESGIFVLKIKEEDLTGSGFVLFLNEGQIQELKDVLDPKKVKERE